jgi:hypothetical protein
MIETTRSIPFSEQADIVTKPDSKKSMSAEDSAG